ncbi:MAG TPA: 2-phosphosulfolactate phosphatase [Gemmatimonadales bacterium]|nr:2-phosphosulfolactate phosphatase [Gemmatimonadales bacterium]
MRLDVVFSPQGLAPTEVAGRTVFVVDVLRACTTICAALHHGARAVIPVGSTEEALRLAQTLDSRDVLLAGERNCVRIPGFALGNSPREMTEETVRGKTLVMTTTNGTRALLATQGAAAVFLAAAANLGRAGEKAREVWERDRDLLVVCAGREQRFSLDDAYAAGRLVLAALGGKHRRKGLNDGALACLDLVRRYGERWERPLAASRAGRELAALGFKDDILESARLDAYPVLAHYHERRVTVWSEPTPA